MFHIFIRPDEMTDQNSRSSQDPVPNRSQSSASDYGQLLDTLETFELPNPRKLISDFITGWITNHNTEPSDADAQELKADEVLEDRIDSWIFLLNSSCESVTLVRNMIMKQMDDEAFRKYKRGVMSWLDEGNAWHQNAEDQSEAVDLSGSLRAIMMEFWHPNNAANWKKRQDGRCRGGFKKLFQFE